MDNEKKTKAAAVKWDSKEQPVPQVIAKGEGAMAQMMVELAQEHNVPIHEDPALVEILSKMNIMDQIPKECYRVVAELLVFIYKAQGRSPDSI